MPGGRTVRSLSKRCLRQASDAREGHSTHSAEWIAANHYFSTYGWQGIPLIGQPVEALAA